jgi:hypoxanthine-guanine phosphoribosyltransferase
MIKDSNQEMFVEFKRTRKLQVKFKYIFMKTKDEFTHGFCLNASQVTQYIPVSLFAKHNQ